MPPPDYCDELTIRNENAEKIKESIAYYTEKYERTLEKVALTRKLAALAEKIDNLISDEALSFSPSEKAKIADDYTLTIFQVGHLARMKDRIGALDIAINTQLDAIAISKEQLAACEDQGITIKLADVRAKLKPFDFIKEKSIKLCVQEDIYGAKVAMLTFSTYGMLCAADSKIQDEYSWLESPHDSPNLMLSPAKVEIHLLTGRLFIKPQQSRVDTQKLRFNSEFITNGVHPHCLHGHEPCLGSYAGPFREAVEQQDWGLVASLIKMYLSSINWKDSAGQSFVSGYFNILKRITMNYEACLMPSEGDGTYKFRELDTPGDYEVTFFDVPSYEMSPDKTTPTSIQYLYLPSKNAIERVNK